MQCAECAQIIDGPPFAIVECVNGWNRHGFGRQCDPRPLICGGKKSKGVDP